MSATGWNRRRFLGLAGVAVGASLGPLAAAERAFSRELGRLGPLRRSRVPQDDGDWADVRAAFQLDKATMNTANLAPASAPARAALEAYTATVDRDPSFQNRGQFDTARRRTRERVAGFIGAEPGEVVLTRNTSEGNNFVVQGVDLGPGDEVLLTEHNHPSNREAWKVRSRRDGFEVTEVPVASPPSGPDELLADLQTATSDRTRVIAFSHVTNLGGCRYPAREICTWARERGILTLVDGAQTCGALALDLRDMSCDFYTASAHKWPCSPREVGLLYVRRESRGRLWPSVVSVGFREEGDAPGRLEALGQRDDAAVAAFGSAVRFLQEIGAGAVEARVAALTDLLKEGLTSLPGVRLYTPRDPAFSAGVVTFHMEGVDARRAFEWLYSERDIVGAPSGVEDGGVRFSPHIYTSMEECRRAVAAVEEIVSGRAGPGA